MLHLECSLRKYLVLNGCDQNAIKYILLEQGYLFEENAVGQLILQDGCVTEEPESLNELLVRLGQSPTRLNNSYRRFRALLFKNHSKYKEDTRMNMLSFIYCEMRKAYKSRVFWVVTIAFTLLPRISLVKYFNVINTSWELYFADVLKTFISHLIMGFAFTTCWIFGREYTNKTINDLLVKPVSKLYIAIFKFIVIFLWNSLLSVIMFMVVVLLGIYIGLTGATITLF
jgi:ABC-type transport system involved in multi-copper enzyme maturation, permease component